jgi:glycyl-tRNA synthetase alpha subunit
MAHNPIWLLQDHDWKYQACIINNSRSKFNVHGSVHHNNILIYIQQEATLHSLFYLETALHVSGGTSTNHQERIQLYLQHLVFVTPLLLPAAIYLSDDSSKHIQSAFSKLFR